MSEKRTNNENDLNYSTLSYFPSAGLLAALSAFSNPIALQICKALFLAKPPYLSFNQLKTNLNLNPNSLSRLLKPLNDLEIVTQEGNHKDHERQRVHSFYALTNSGREIFLSLVEIDEKYFPIVEMIAYDRIDNVQKKISLNRNEICTMGERSINNEIGKDGTCKDLLSDVPRKNSEDCRRFCYMSHCDLI